MRSRWVQRPEIRVPVIKQYAGYQEPPHIGPDVGSDDPTSANPAPLSSPKLPSNYFLRHWHGGLSLPVSYWVNGSILAAIVPTILFAAISDLKNRNYSLREISFAILGVLLFSVAAWLWSVVGIWRSAGHHVARGGSSGWASAARVMVVISFFAMAGQLSNNILPQLWELGHIAIGHDPIGEIDVKVATDGKSVIVTGTLREGSAVVVERILEAAPGATSLILNSNGGRLLEAERLAKVVRKRNLDTYVETECASACTYVFLAGKGRAAAPNARIGFHQPSFAGIDANAQQEGTQNMLDFYRASGLPEAFIKRVGQTSSDEMWYPTYDELIASNVITRDGEKVSGAFSYK